MIEVRVLRRGEDPGSSGEAQGDQSPGSWGEEAGGAEAGAEVRTEDRGWKDVRKEPQKAESPQKPTQSKQQVLRPRASRRSRPADTVTSPREDFL